MLPSFSALYTPVQQLQPLGNVQLWCTILEGTGIRSTFGIDRPTWTTVPIIFFSYFFHKL